MRNCREDLGSLHKSTTLSTQPLCSFYNCCARKVAPASMQGSSKTSSSNNSSAIASSTSISTSTEVSLDSPTASLAPQKSHLNGLPQTIGMNGCKRSRFNTYLYPAPSSLPPPFASFWTGSFCTWEAIWTPKYSSTMQLRPGPKNITAGAVTCHLARTKTYWPATSCSLTSVSGMTGAACSLA